MPIHDWTRVTAGTFHDFHSAWIVGIRGRLNGGVLPDGYYAMAEQVTGNAIADVLTLQGAPNAVFGGNDGECPGEGGVAVATAPPRASLRDHLIEAGILASMQRRVVIRHTNGDQVVALLELVSPGNKFSRDAVAQFVQKAGDAVHGGLHLLVIDLFPPRSFDPTGMHGRLWNDLGGTYTPPVDKPLTLASYVTGGSAGVECYVEPTAVGATLLEMPLFLSTGRYVNVPLEETYQAAYVGVPRRWKQVIEAQDVL